MFQYFINYDPDHEFTWQEKLLGLLMVVGFAFFASISGINF